MDMHNEVTQPASLQMFNAVRAVSNEYLAFRLGAQEYGIGIMNVKEIRTYEKPTRMAGARACVPGVLNLRGDIVPVVDLRTRFGLPDGIDEHTVTVVMGLPSGIVGVVVDAVSDVLELRPDEIKPVPTVNASRNARLFQGLGCTRHADEDRTLIVMNLRDLMSHEMAQA